MGKAYGRKDYRGTRSYTVEIHGSLTEFKVEATFDGYEIPAHTNCLPEHATPAEGEEWQYGDTRWTINRLKVTKEKFAEMLMEAIEAAMNCEDLELER
jgi:hypothetical protein